MSLHVLRFPVDAVDSWDQVDTAAANIAAKWTRHTRDEARDKIESGEWPVRADLVPATAAQAARVGDGRARILWSGMVEVTV